MSTIQELVDSWDVPRPPIDQHSPPHSWKPYFRLILGWVVQDLILISRLSIVQEDQRRSWGLAESICTNPELQEWTQIHLDLPQLEAEVETESGHLFQSVHFVGRTGLIEAKKTLVKTNLARIRKMLVSSVDATEPIRRIANQARQTSDAGIAEKQDHYLAEVQKYEKQKQLAQEKLRAMKAEIDEACWAGVSIDRTEPRRVWEETLALIDETNSTLRELDVL